MAEAAHRIPVNIEEEMKRSYLDYAMSVIIGRALPHARDRVGAGPSVQEIGYSRRRCARQVSPAWRHRGLRFPRANGARFLAALSAGGWPGQLRVGRR